MHSATRCPHCDWIIALLPGDWQEPERQRPGEKVPAGHAGLRCASCGRRYVVRPVAQAAA